MGGKRLLQGLVVAISAVVGIIVWERYDKYVHYRNHLRTCTDGCLFTHPGAEARAGTQQVSDDGIRVECLYDEQGELRGFQVVAAGNARQVTTDDWNPYSEYSTVVTHNYN